MEAYIDGTCAISPQNSFEGETLLTDIREYDAVRHIKCIEPHYSELIDPMTSRRMSRIIKMGVASALKPWTMPESKSLTLLSAVRDWAA
jgi:hypothetical protein